MLFGNYLLDDYEDVHLYLVKETYRIPNCDGFLFFFFLRKTAEYSVPSYVNSQYKITVNHLILQNTFFFFIEFILLKLHKNYVNVYLYFLV